MNTWRMLAGKAKRTVWAAVAFLPSPLDRLVANVLRRHRGYPIVTRISYQDSFRVLHTRGRVWPRGYPSLLRTSSDASVGSMHLNDLVIDAGPSFLGTVRFPASAVLALSEFPVRPLGRTVQIGAGEGEEVNLLRLAQAGRPSGLTLVEASPRSCAKIRARLAILKDPSIDLICGAVSARRGTVRILEEANFLESRVSAAGEGTHVDAYTLVEVLGDEDTDLLLMNIEGSEVEVVPLLLSAPNKPRRVAIATHDFLDFPSSRATSPFRIAETVARSLMAAGYTVWGRSHAAYAWERGWVFGELSS